MRTLLALASTLSLLMAVSAGAGERSASDNVEFAQSRPGPTIEQAPSGARCEWIPQPENLPAPQCGFNDAGVPHPGIFDCGVRTEGGSCVRHCVFKSCNEP